MILLKCLKELARLKRISPETRRECKNMAQAGLHGIVGVASAGPVNKVLKKKVSLENRKLLIWGLVLGNLIPDADFFLLGPAYLFDAELAMGFHRTFSHSILFIALVALVMAFKNRYLAVGLGVGMLMHALFDMLIWFSSVDFLWPLGMFGVSSTVYIWANVSIPEYLSALMGAFDYLAFGLYYLYLGKKAREFGTNEEFLPLLAKWTRLQWLFLVIFVPLAFVLPLWLFNIAHYAFFILFFFPLSLYITVKMRPTIEAFAEGIHSRDVSV